MSSIGTIHRLIHRAAWHGVRERPAPVEKPTAVAAATGREPARPLTLARSVLPAPTEAFRASQALPTLRPGARTLVRGSAETVPHSARVERVARLEVLGTATVSSLDEPLGDAVAGAFILNGIRVEVASGDSLRTLRERVNSLASRSGVRAETVEGASGEQRLALFNEAPEGGEIALLDETAEGPLSRLGMVGREVEANRNAKGEAETASFSSAKLAIASLLGVVTYPPPASLKINGRTVMIDLEVDSLSSIAARVLAEARTEAAIQEEEVGGSLRYRLAVDGAVEPAGPADAHAAALVGFVRSRPAPLPSLRYGRDAEPERDSGSGRPLREAARSAMLELFTAIDAAMGRVREQAAPLAIELRELGPDPESN